MAWKHSRSSPEKGNKKKTITNQARISWEVNVKMFIAMSLMLEGAGVYVV